MEQAAAVYTCIFLLSFAILYNQITRYGLIRAAVYTCIFLFSLAILYDQITKSIPTRSLPEYGLIPAAAYNLSAHAHGIE